MPKYYRAPRDFHEHDFIALDIAGYAVIALRRFCSSDVPLVNSRGAINPMYFRG